MMIEGQGILLLGDNDVDGGEGRGLEESRGGLPEEIMPSYTEQLLTSHNLPYHPSEDDEQCEITNVSHTSEMIVTECKSIYHLN